MKLSGVTMDHAIYAVGGGPPKPNCEWRIVNCELGCGDPPYLAVQHCEVDIGHRPRGAIARLVGITSNLSKVHVNAKAILGRCKTKCKATRSCASDAEHEFPRIRSAGLFSMMPFRRSGYPQLLLMQPTLIAEEKWRYTNR
jgi:hypothetical protein